MSSGARQSALTTRSTKVVVAKMGLDSHYRGAVAVARYLAQRGMEVVYIGNQLPEQIVEAVVQEDAHVLGLSSLSGNHMVMVPRVLEDLRRRGVDGVLVLLGGVIPTRDADALKALGVAQVFGTGSNLEEIATFIESNAALR